MYDATKTMITSLATGALKKVLMTGGAAATAHGLTEGGNSAEIYVGLATAIIAAGYSFWTDYGKAIVVSQLEVLKARSLAAAKKIQDAGLRPVTVSEIAAQSPTLTPDQVTKTAAGMTPEVKATVVPLSERTVP